MYLRMLNQLDTFYFNLAEPQQSCLLFLRTYLLNYSPHISESFKYQTAFFSFKGKMFCYFSVSKKTGKTYIGFAQGYNIKHKKLESEGRITIKVFYVDPANDVDIKSLNEILKLVVKLY